MHGPLSKRPLRTAKGLSHAGSSSPHVPAHAWTLVKASLADFQRLKPRRSLICLRASAPKAPRWLSLRHGSLWLAVQMSPGPHILHPPSGSSARLRPVHLPTWSAPCPKSSTSLHAEGLHGARAAGCSLVPALCVPTERALCVPTERALCVPTNRALCAQTERALCVPTERAL